MYIIIICVSAYFLIVYLDLFCSNIFYNQILFLVYVTFYSLQSLYVYLTSINNNSCVHSLLQSMFGVDVHKHCLQSAPFPAHNVDVVVIV